MSARIQSITAASAIVASFGLIFAPVQADPVPGALLHYEIIPLPTLAPPGTNNVNSNATGLNELGHCVGIAEADGGINSRPIHAVIWIDGEVIDLGATTEPHYGGYAKGINDNDMAVGWWIRDVIDGPGATSRPFVAPLGQTMFDPAFGVGFQGESWGINNSGQTCMTIGSDLYVYDPVNGLRGIGLGGPIGFGPAAWEINNNGQVCGVSPGADAHGHSFRYDYATDTIEDLHDPIAYWATCGYGINDNGDIAGWGEQHDNFVRPIVWAADSSVVVLPILDLGPAHFLGRAEHINNHGDVVGNDVSSLPEPPIGWISFDVLDATTPDKIALHSLLSPQAQTEWLTNMHPFEINENRQIAGTGTINGETRGFLMTPVLVGDLNGDCMVDTADLGIVLGQFGTSDPGADINGDGVVDAADLGILLSAFGVNCSSAW